ncbi:nitrogen regulation protein NR(II) [Thiohalobacter thiocyanaticus]|uniref:Sensory histidine kinase/phosphatase NtrB n=1 Tax=Thiohalobacter thiocyanaticus TaxID=585455 RepID=A0A426QJR1_9GAMM|nr:nitrogen regulation protein NR(II) [Thiohalobacter thiocyanaticus]RRQ21993.1 nitrogen regulation protein NR(II) [Thiohalobacter thiocyanaticus]
MNAQLTPMSREKTILDNITTAILVVDPELRVEYMNPAAEMLLAQSAGHATGHSLPELMPASGALLDRVREALDENRTYTERELVLTLHQGSEVTVDCTLSPRQDGGPPAQVLIELIQVDRHLRISREENLLEQSQAMRQLVRGLAHEIKNPLGGLRGAAQLLERELESEELKEYTRIIIGEADRLRALVNRMLGPHNLPQKRLSNIHQILEHVRSLVIAESHREIEVERDYDPSIPDFDVDPEMLIQAILNIMRNAARAMEGHGTIRLRTRTLRQFTIGQRRHRLVLRLDVEDNGPGIPPELMETIFYPMVTGQAEGTGLGLSISQSLINLHGGLIECESTPGRTMFTVLLPLEPLE